MSMVDSNNKPNVEVNFPAGCTEEQQKKQKKKAIFVVPDVGRGILLRY